MARNILILLGFVCILVFMIVNYDVQEEQTTRLFDIRRALNSGRFGNQFRYLCMGTGRRGVKSSERNGIERALVEGPCCLDMRIQELIFVFARG